MNENERKCFIYRGTFYLWLYGIRHMGKDHSDSEKKRTPATWATLYN